MTWTLDQARAPLHGALRIPDAVSFLGRALWLYVLLLMKAGDTGRVIQTTTRLAKDLSMPEDAIVRWLDRLRDARLITISSPSPYLVARIVFWPGRTSSSEPNAAQGSAVEQSRLEDLHSSSYSSAISISEEDRGLGEGETLLPLAREVLGDAADIELPTILANYPAHLVAKALERARKAPEERIRKSRAALFRYILTKLAHDSRP